LNDDFRIQAIFNEGPITVEAELSRLLLGSSIQRVYLATAFLTMGGYWAIEEGLRAVIQRTPFVKMVVGTLGQATDPDAIRAIQALTLGKERIRLYTAKFHPKMYLFQTGALESTLIVGSPNLTDAGLQSNVEAALRLDVSPRSGHYHLINKCIEQFNRWWRDAFPIKDVLPAYEKVYCLRRHAKQSVEEKWKEAGEKIPLPPPPPLPEPLPEIYLLPFDVPMSEEQIQFIRSKGWMQREDSHWYALPKESWASVGNLKPGQRIVGYHTHRFPDREFRYVCCLGLMLAKKYRGETEFFIELAQDPELSCVVELPVGSLGRLLPCVQQGERIWKKELDRIHCVASPASFNEKFGVIRALVQEIGKKSRA